MMLGVSSSIIVQMFEMVFIGQLGTQAVAAITFTFPLTMALSSIALGISIGTSSVIARRVGAGKRSSARRLATHSLMLVAVLMSALSLCGWLAIVPLFTRLGAAPETLLLIQSYLDIAFLSFPFLTVMMVAGSVMRANGNANTPGIAMTTASLLNLALDPILIFGLLGAPRLELAGAAWALGISRILVCLALLAYIRRDDMVQLQAVLRGFAESCRAVLHIGVPAMATQMIGPVSAGIITALLAQHGEDVLAGFGIAGRIEAVAVMLLFALSGSIGPFVGQNWGAGAKARVRSGVHAAYTFCVLWGLLACLALFLFGDALAGMVDDNGAAVATAATYLAIVPLSYGAWGVLMMASASFNALGKPLPSTVLSFCRMFLVYVPLAFAFNRWFGVGGIFAATAIANVLLGIAGCLWFRSVFLRPTPASAATA
ncbi:MAG: MATE family efflux transporter [Pseudomonadota bacterium]